MTPRRAPILALIAAVIIVSPAVAGDSIVVAAPDAEATVTPRTARVRAVNLPPLSFSLRAAIRCSGEAVSVTLSIADTYVTRERNELEGQRATEATLTVPAGQLAMASSREFCIADNTETGDELFAPGFATAHASLRCSGDSGETVHYTSAPLNLRLSCAREAVDNEADQESSSSEGLSELPR